MVIKYVAYVYSTYYSSDCQTLTESQEWAIAGLLPQKTTHSLDILSWND